MTITTAATTAITAVLQFFASNSEKVNNIVPFHYFAVFHAGIGSFVQAG